MRKAQPLVGPLGYTDEDMASDRRGRAQVRTQNPAIQDILRRLSGGVGYQGNTPGDKVMVMQDYGAEPNFGSFNPFKLDDPMNESAIAQAEMARVGVDRAGPMGLDGMSDRFKRPPSRFGNSYGGFGIPRIEMGMGDNSKLLGGSPPSTKVIDPYYERRKRQFSDRATMKRPKAKPRVRKSTAFDQAWSLLKQDKSAEVMDVISQNANDPDFMEYLSMMDIHSIEDVTSNLNDPDFVDYIHGVLVQGDVVREPLSHSIDTDEASKVSLGLQDSSWQDLMEEQE